MTQKGLIRCKTNQPTTSLSVWIPFAKKMLSTADMTSLYELFSLTLYQNMTDNIKLEDTQNWNIMKISKVRKLIWTNHIVIFIHFVFDFLFFFSLCLSSSIPFPLFLVSSFSLPSWCLLFPFYFSYFPSFSHFHLSLSLYLYICIKLPHFIILLPLDLVVLWRY